MARRRRQSLEDLLLRYEGVTMDHVHKALQMQREQGLSLYGALNALDTLKEETVAMILSEVARVPYINLKNYRIPEDMLLLIPAGISKVLKVAPLSRINGMVTVAVSDPLNIPALDWVRKLTGSRVAVMVGTSADIEYAVDNVGDMVEKEVKTGEEEAETLGELFERLDSDVSSSENKDKDQAETRALGEDEIIRLVDMILLTAVRQGVSDIHLEPYENVFRVRYRLDGHLKVVSSPPIGMYTAICSRLKIMSDLNIAEHRIPQDGRMKVAVDDKEADLRVSILPTYHGEKIVMRVLDRDNVTLDLTKLGFDAEQEKLFVEAIEQPNGIILVTGPTGSGKTTTLYTALSILNKEDVNIITLEDPVEYDLFAINQVQANAKVGLTFASGLRSILRQDPDIVMVGEIRDNETAEIAIKAALTGHLVLSTLHTNDAVGAIFRLLDMDTQPFMLAASLKLCQAQRLVRKLCSKCRKPVELPGDVRAEVEGLIKSDHEGPIAYEPQGCTLCSGTGYVGRSSLLELCSITPEIRELIVQGETAVKIQEASVRQGMRPLYQDGLTKIINGITSLEEVLRVAAA